ncbi:DNA cytosine methyltransferase [Agromyces endophyticus]|uniref:DNA cytosine methyltransferase n=1 Tax=Agromyces sp. H17E-10 TaxID=2932244 RepID=UPI001FD282CD|nr:DNA cytosine methyltransferase [Agromyces sp. H17E-10]UOQ88057.1 DNA cytosine methyltransferase [Agromyces sp. H17E-10]
MTTVASRHPLRARERPDFSAGSEKIRLVDLFAGCGGLTLGIAQALQIHEQALEVALAVDFESLATEVYSANFVEAERVEAESIETYFDGTLGEPLTLAERRLKGELGDITALVGGPPCQGHSNLNNHTRRVDAKNALYLRMVRAAEVLDPSVIIIENVPAVLRDRHDGEGVVARAERHLKSLEYQVEHQVVGVDSLGVAQTRRRHILLATKRGEIPPEDLFANISANPIEHDLEWAIGDLVGVESDSLIDRAPQAKADNLTRMQWLLDNDEYDLPNRLRPTCHQDSHSYKSMYGRLKWTEPAQTITSGFGSIGQGRYMHPDLPRALTAHEAARIQGFPDYFDFSACPTRSALATMIGNAVPPQLGSAIFEEILKFRAITGQTGESPNALPA